MTNPLTIKSWSPDVAGAGIGILSWFAFASADRPIGITHRLGCDYRYSLPVERQHGSTTGGMVPRPPYFPDSYRAYECSSLVALFLKEL